MPGVCAGSYTGHSRGSGFVLRFCVHFDVSGPVLYMGGDSVHSGLPLLVSSHAGGCGRLLLIFLCYCLSCVCACGALVGLV